MSIASSINPRNRSCRLKCIETPYNDQFSFRPLFSFGHCSNNPDLPMGNAVDHDLGRTCNEASGEDQIWKSVSHFPLVQ